MQIIENIAFASGFMTFIMIIIYGKMSEDRRNEAPELVRVIMILVLAIFIASAAFSLLNEFFKTNHLYETQY